MDAQSEHAHAEEAEQQQQQQPQQQNDPSGAAASPAGAPSQDPAGMQAQAAAQLQLQQMQWAAYLQAQQQFLAAQQAQLAAAGFNPQDASGQVHAAAATSQYRSQYQHGYGAYPSQQDGAGEQQQQQQQQMQTLLPGGLLPPLLQQHQMLTSGYGAGGFVDLSGSSSLRRRDREKPAPSVDPNAWNDSITYPSKSNPDRYLAHRSYFSDVPPIVNRLPRKPELKALVQRGRDFYASNRDPRFYQPVLESGWDNRAQVLKTPITPGPLAIGAAAFKKEYSGLNASAAAAAAQHQQQHSHSADGDSGTPPLQLPSIEEAKQQFGQFPVLIHNSPSRPGSKLLVPFLHNWPPPFRFDFLKKHSRAPLSPFLASLNGYDVPQELFLSAKQQRELARAQAGQQQQQLGGDYHTGYPMQMGYDSGDGASSSRPNPHSSDPVERARARAHTHTTYWRTVPPEGVDPASAASASARQQQQQQHAGSRKREWNFRHHLTPPEPRVGQTTPRKPPSGGRGGRTQQQAAALAQQQALQHQALLQQQAILQQQMMALSQGQLPVGSFGFPAAAAATGGGAGSIDPNLLAQWQAEMYAQQMALLQQQEQLHWQQQQQQQQHQAQEEEKEEQQQQQQQYSQPRSTDEQQQQPHDSDADGSGSSHPPRAAAGPADDGFSQAPDLNPRAQSHVKEVYNQLYHKQDDDEQKQQQQQQHTEEEEAAGAEQQQ